MHFTDTKTEISINKHFRSRQTTDWVRKGGGRRSGEGRVWGGESGGAAAF